MSVSLPSQVRKAAPAIDSVVSDYAAGYVQHVADSTATSHNLDVEGEVAFIVALLKDAGGDPTAISKLSEELNSELNNLYSNNASKRDGDGTRKLDKDTLVHAQRHNQNTLSAYGNKDATELDLLSGRKIESRVDKKKLEKAEKKIQQKLEKRARRNVEYEASKLLADENKQDYDQFFLTVNPLEYNDEGKDKNIKLDNIDLYVGAGQRILSNTTLTLSHGHRYGLVGQNGIGKSTLLKALSRRELAVPKHITILYVEQEVTGDDRSVMQTVLDADVWRKKLLEEQDSLQSRISELSEEREKLGGSMANESDPEVKRVEDERGELETSLSEVYEKLQDIEADKAESKAGVILAGLGFSTESHHQPTKAFSGGWRMRISLARALFFKPDLLLLDEPSNMLDVPSITFLANYLQSYPSTVLVVSHDRAFLNEVATDIIHQHNERLDYYRGSDFDSFYATKEERRKNAFREYENQMAHRKHLQAFIDKFRYNAARAQEAQSRIKKLEKLPVLEPPEDEKTQSFTFPNPDKLTPPIIQLQNVTFGYTPEKPILQNVDLDVQLDSRIALVGGNGCGKTTLLKLLMEYISPTKGFVTRNPRLRVGYFAQHHIDQMDLNLTPVQWMGKIYPGKTDEEYRRMLGAFGITGTLGVQKIALLSGGQKSRVAFACLCLNTPHILILDEPSNHLDTAGLDALADALHKFEGGILMVSHDVATIERVCRQIWVSENGTVKKFDGSIHDYKKYILSKANASGVVAKQ